MINKFDNELNIIVKIENCKTIDELKLFQDYLECDITTKYEIKVGNCGTNMIEIYTFVRPHWIGRVTYIKNMLKVVPYSEDNIIRSFLFPIENILEIVEVERLSRINEVYRKKYEELEEL